MLVKLKELWARWKVQVSVVGGVLIIASAYGTCTYEAPVVEEAPADNAVETEATETETEATETETEATVEATEASPEASSTEATTE